MMENVLASKMAPKERQNKSNLNIMAPKEALTSMLCVLTSIMEPRDASTLIHDVERTVSQPSTSVVEVSTLMGSKSC